MAKGKGTKKVNLDLNTSLSSQTQGGVIGFLRRFPELIIIAFALLLYANTLGHEYASDDAIVITENEFTLKGVEGIPELMTNDAFVGFFGKKKDLVAGGRYRPLSMVSFALEYELFKLNPGISHFLNNLFYGLTGVILFWILGVFFGFSREKDWWLGIPFLVSMLFIAHPLHTEVVANIKGRDEIFCLLFSLLSLFFSIRFITKGEIISLLISSLFFFLGLLSKENAVPFLAIIPSGLWLFLESDKQKLGKVLLALVFPTVIYLFLRTQYTGGGTGDAPTEILNNPFLYASFSEKIATVIYTFGRYILLFLFPLVLTHDYYFNQVPVTSFADPAVWISLLVALGLIYLGIKHFVKKSSLSWGLVVFWASFSVVCNLFFPIGTMMGERFLYIPSLGLIIFVFQIIKHKGLSIRQSPILKYGIYTILIVFSIRTVARNPVWKNNFTLFTTDVHNSPNSAKLQTSAGGDLVAAAKEEKSPVKKAKMYRQAITHLKKALKIYPNHGIALLILGNAYYYSGQPEEGIKTLQYLLKVKPGYKDAANNLQFMAQESGRSDILEGVARAKVGSNPTNFQQAFELGLAFEKGAKVDSAMKWFEKTLELNPEHAASYAKIGSIYGKNLGDMNKAIEYLEIAIQKGEEEWMIENLGIAYAMKGEKEKAVKILQSAVARYPKSGKIRFNLAISLREVGRIDESNKFLEEAKALSPELFRQN